MRCPRCDADTRPGSRFCAECGSSLPAACPSCGFIVEPAAKFCGGCGAALAHQPSPQAQAPRHLAERILTSKGALEGERKLITVLFADLKGSMEMLADSDPEDARSLLDAVLSRMMDAVHRYEGTVNQVLGDGIMALFGAPLALEDHAVRASSAALAMQEAITRYAAETGNSALRIRIGLNSGEVVVRAIGSDLHMDYTAIGQTTHLAARMEQMASPGTILMTADTLRLAEGYVHARSLGPAPIKGLREPIEVFELLGMASARARLQVSAARGFTPFVGRELERRVMPQALARASAGHGQVVAVVGEPGVGKSRLTWEFTHSPETTGWLSLESRATSYSNRTPYFTVVDMLKGYFGIDDRDEPVKIRERVNDRLRVLGQPMQSAETPLLALLNGPVDDSQWDALEPAARRRQIMDSTKGLLIRESQVQPVLLTFEDLQWVDSETEALLDSMVESLADARMLLLVNYRPGYAHNWDQKPYYTQFRIDPLAAENAQHLLSALLGDAPELWALSRTLIDRTGGNPFFLEESVRTLVETGALAGSRGAYRLTQPVTTIEIPGTVQAILAARVDRLAPEDKFLLQCASVIGKDASFPLLRELTQLSDDDLSSGLNHLQEAEFLYETSLFPELEYTFKHALTHDVAYLTLLQDRRRQLHARTAGAMERLYADRPPTDHVERLALHAYRGELWEQAVTSLRQAGAKAQRGSANREAVAWFEQTLDALAHLPEARATRELGVDLRLDLRGSLYPLGEFERMAAHLREAGALAERLGDERRIGWVSLHLGEYFRQTGRVSDACPLIERAQAIADGLPDTPLRLASYHYLALARHALGECRAAADLLLAVGAAWSKQTDYAPGTFGGAVTGMSAGSLAINLAWRARCLSDCGDFTEGLGCAREGLAIAENLASPYSLASTTFALGYLRAVKGELPEAIANLERTLATARESRITLYEAHALRTLGLAYALSGRGAEGVDLLEHCLALVESKSILLQHATTLATLAEALLLVGRRLEALPAARRALTAARERGQRGDEAVALRLCGDAASEHDQRQEAEQCYRDALILAAELEMQPQEGRCHLGIGRLYLRIGQRDLAEEHLVAAAKLFCAIDMEWWLGRVVEVMKELGPLLIVGADNVALYDSLCRVVEGGQGIQVVVDRRLASSDPFPVEADRRRDGHVAALLRTRGLVVSHAP